MWSLYYCNLYILGHMTSSRLFYPLFWAVVRLHSQMAKTLLFFAIFVTLLLITSYCLTSWGHQKYIYIQVHSIFLTSWRAWVIILQTTVPLMHRYLGISQYEKICRFTFQRPVLVSKHNFHKHPWTRVKHSLLCRKTPLLVLLHSTPLSFDLRNLDFSGH